MIRVSEKLYLYDEVGGDGTLCIWFPPGRQPLTRKHQRKRYRLRDVDRLAREKRDAMRRARPHKDSSSLALGCHPKQVKAFNGRAKAEGLTGVKYSPDGVCNITSRKQGDQWMDAIHNLSERTPEEMPE